MENPKIRVEIAKDGKVEISVDGEKVDLSNVLSANLSIDATTRSLILRKRESGKNCNRYIEEIYEF